MDIMDNYQISTTELKQRISEVINMVYFNRKTAIIKRHGKTVAKLVPPEDSTYRTKKVKKTLDDYFGILPDFPDVVKDRRSRKKTVHL